MYCIVLYCTVPYSTVLYKTVQHFTYFVDTHLLEKCIRPLMLGRLDKKFSGWVGGGGIAIIASSSRAPGET